MAFKGKAYAVSHYLTKLALVIFVEVFLLFCEVVIYSVPRKMRNVI